MTVTGEPHVCDEFCRCPVHRTPAIYWPQGDDHACQDVTCEYGHGFYRAQAGIEYRRAERLRKEYLALEAAVVAGLSTEAHRKVMRAGLPFCECGHSLAGGKATDAFIYHALTVLSAERDRLGRRPGASKLVSLEDLPADLRFAVQFCPRCSQHEYPYFFLCEVHGQGR